jgi:colanic acid/amylovoran biosynthesis glycosyltransferase
MTLAIWTTKFPDLTETFIEAEVEFLKEQYPTLSINSLKPGLKSDLKVQCFLYWDPRNIFAFLKCWLSSFSTMAKLATELWSGFENCPRPFERLKSFMLWPAACRAHGVLKAQGCNQLMSHWANVPSTVAWICSRLGDWPLIMVLHGENLSSIWPQLEKKCREAQKVITCTQFNKERLEEAMPGLEVTFHAHGVSLLSDQKIEKEEDSIFTGLTVGRLVGTKGYKTLLQALLLLKQQGLSFRWTIVGEGPDEFVLKEFCRQNSLTEEVFFEGALGKEQVLKLYGKHQVFVLPIEKGEDGDSDGLPNVILEAMAGNCPVISTDTAGVSEALSQRENALLVPVADAEALVTAILEIKENAELSRQLKENARSFVAEEFDRKQCHDDLLETLKPLLEAKA